MDLCPESLWEELCRADSTCTFYQTPAWLHIAARNVGAEIAPLLFRTNGEPACLPLLKKKRWGSDRYFSPFGTYAALICATPLESKALADIAAVLKGLNLSLVSSPCTRNAIALGKPFTSRTQVIDLATLEPENLIRDWDQDQKRRLRIAQRNGVRVRLADSPEDWERYYELYRLSLRRWRRPAAAAYPKALFDDIRRSLSGNSAMKLWLAEHQGMVGAGYLTFRHNRHFAPWHGAADQRFFSLGASQILIQAMVQDALQSGCACFDFMGSGGHSGVEAFKSAFGMKTVEFQSSSNRVGTARFIGWLGDLRRAGAAGIDV